MASKTTRRATPLPHPQQFNVTSSSESSWVHGEEEKGAQSEPGSCASEAAFVLPQKWPKNK
jgi:hypothetical protein